MADIDSDQPGCSLADSAEALGILVAVEAEIGTDSELDSSNDECGVPENYEESISFRDKSSSESVSSVLTRLRYPPLLV